MLGDRNHHAGDSQGFYLGVIRCKVVCKSRQEVSLFKRMNG
jgi:hypothetical protein